MLYTLIYMYIQLAPPTTCYICYMIYLSFVLTGDGQTYNVLPPETLPEETERESDKVPQQPLDDKQEEETVVVEVVKKKTFTGLKAAGLRVRAQPSFAAPSIALIKPGMVLSYSEEVSHVTII